MDSKYCMKQKTNKNITTSIISARRQLTEHSERSPGLTGTETERDAAESTRFSTLVWSSALRAQSLTDITVVLS